MPWPLANKFGRWESDCALRYFWASTELAADYASSIWDSACFVNVRGKGDVQAMRGEKEIPHIACGAPAEREERTTSRWEVTCLPPLHSEQSGVNLLSHDRIVSWLAECHWEKSIVRNENPSPPRGVALHDTILNPAGCVDKKENENTYGPLANETEDSPAAKLARLKPVLDDMARGLTPP